MTDLKKEGIFATACGMSLAQIRSLCRDIDYKLDQIQATLEKRITALEDKLSPPGPEPAKTCAMCKHSTLVSPTNKYTAMHVWCELDREKTMIVAKSIFQTCTKWEATND